MTDLGSMLHPAQSWARGINDKGHVVGYAKTPGGQMFPFLWDGELVFDLRVAVSDTGGATIEQAIGINDKGQIAVCGRLGGRRRAFLLSVDEANER